MKQTPKGFRDFLPEDARVRESVITTLKEVFSSYGFAPLETPAIEYKETLLGKYGEEAEKLIYLFKDRGGRDVGLRYDLTVPLARVVAQYGDKLPLPFKRYQIAPVWRADKPQAGRFREFWQADIDIVGSSSFLGDVEIISTVDAALKKLGFKNYKIKFNSRGVLFSIIKKAGIPEKLKFQVIRVIDKISKIGWANLNPELIKLGIDNEKAQTLNNLLSTLETPIEDRQVAKVWETCSSADVRSLEFDPTLARGLDYYTGMIFEVVIPGYDAGSIGGGGRYDELIGKFAGQDLPTVGFSFGIDRVIEALKQTGVLIEKGEITAPDILITVFDEKLVPQSIEVAKRLKAEGFSVEVYPDEQTSLDKQLKYADKRGIEWITIIGPDEAKNKTVTWKNLLTRTQEVLPESKLPQGLS